LFVLPAKPVDPVMRRAPAPVGAGPARCTPSRLRIEASRAAFARGTPGGLLAVVRRLHLAIRSSCGSGAGTEAPALAYPGGHRAASLDAMFRSRDRQKATANFEVCLVCWRSKVPPRLYVSA